MDCVTYDDIPQSKSARANFSQEFPHTRVEYGEIPGLRLYPDFITRKMESDLITELDNNTWDNTLKRRTQMYGFIHDYFSKRKLTASTAVETKDLLPHMQDLRDDLYELTGTDFNTVIVNEYIGSQGVTPHVDKLHFEETVVSVSLLQGVHMPFTRISDSKKVNVWLPPRSVLIMEGESRYKWKHEIPRNKTILDPNGERKRHSDWRRVSITYRMLN